MIEAEEPQRESERLAALLAYEVLDTDPEREFDDLTAIASSICDTPIALVSLLDDERQWFKSRHGLDATETARNVSFCSHAILEPERVFIVCDSHLDERFHDNPLVRGGPEVRFYAGAPLVTPAGLPMGTLCVIDRVPRELDDHQLDLLRKLSRQVVSQLELRRHNRELREASEEVRRANEDLRQFTSIAAHDLRGPVVQLSSFVELLEDDLTTESLDEAREDMVHIRTCATRMDALVRALYELSCVGSGGLEPRSTELADCVAVAGENLGVSDADLEVGDLPEVRCDEVLVTQVFQNLIGNALKYCEGRPRIRVSVESEDGEDFVEVRDNGIGMQPEHAELVFAPFRRLHGKDDYEGAGIGLATVKKIVERHGGRVWALSSPGEGSRFRFTLPGLRAPARVTRAA